MRLRSVAAFALLTTLSFAGLLAADSAQAGETCTPDRIEVPSWYCVGYGSCGFGCQEVCVGRYDDYGRDWVGVCQQTPNAS